MKKIFAFVVFFILMVSLCACTNETTVDTSSELVSSEETSSLELIVEETVSEEENLGWEEFLHELRAPNGNVFKMPAYGYIIDQHADRCLIKFDTEIWLCDQNVGLKKLTGDQIVINYTVAYDTIYWFNLDKDVWAVDWYRSDEAYLFCEDAIAVSPHIDEAEGAVVEWERANIDYGYGLPIYSPYGIKK